MAVRQAPQTEPVLDNSALDANPETEKSLVVHALPKVAYSSLIMACQTLPLESLKVIQSTTKDNLARLGVKQTGKAHKKSATGSSQFDPGSFITWANGVQAEDKVSVDQLLGIDATVRLRFTKKA